MSTLFADSDTQELVARARAHQTPNYRQPPLFLTRGEGMWVWDRDGKRYLDMFGGIAVNALGHAHPRLVAAIRDQADKLCHVSNIFFHEPGLALMDELVSRSFADRVFFTNSGTEANEAALKIARRFQTVVRGQAARTDFLTFEHGFHGRTFASLTATAQPKYHEGFTPLLPGFHYAPYGDLEAAGRVMAEVGDRLAAVLVEPLQGEGGVRVPPKGYLSGLRKLCDEHGALLMLDEVQTGVGRTGEWFAYEIEGVRPDVMSLAKGLGGGVPLGAMVCTEEVGQAFVPGTHASTFGGNPLATRVGLEVMRTIGEEGLLDHIYEAGEYLGRGLAALCKDKPEVCRETRGYGLLRGLEIDDADPDFPNRVVEQARQRGFLLNVVAGNTLRFAPAFVVQRGHIDATLEMLSDVLDGARA